MSAPTAKDIALTLNPSKLIDALLDGRKALLTAQEMSPKGAPIWTTLECAIGDVDVALRLARAIGKAAQA